MERRSTDLAREITRKMLWNLLYPDAWQSEKWWEKRGDFYGTNPLPDRYRLPFHLLCPTLIQVSEVYTTVLFKWTHCLIYRHHSIVFKFNSCGVESVFDDVDRGVLGVFVHNGSQTTILSCTYWVCLLFYYYYDCYWCHYSCCWPCSRVWFNVPTPPPLLTCLTLPSSILTSTVGTCTSTSNTTVFIVPVTYSTGHTSQVECPLMTDYTFSGPVNITQDYCQVVLPDCVCSHVSELGSSSSQEFRNWGCVRNGTLFPIYTLL